MLSPAAPTAVPGPTPRVGGKLATELLDYHFLTFTLTANYFCNMVQALLK